MMVRVKQALLGALAVAGVALVVSAPAKAAVGFSVSAGPAYGSYYDDGAGYGPDYGPPPGPDYGPPPYDQGYGGYDPNYGGDPYYDDYAYDEGYYDPSYACDYYTPPWGYPPDFCSYQLWNEPVFFGGSWFSGPIYYRDYGGSRSYWLNGGWRHDEWRGARPGGIDWGRNGNTRWTGDIRHGGRGFAGGNFGGRSGFDNRFNGTAGGFNGGRRDFRGGNFTGGQVGGGGFSGRRDFGG